MKVLLIDDDADIRFVAAMSLRRIGGMTVVEGAGSVEGLRKARDEQPDVILLDMMMPTMDGTATLAALRAAPETAKTPVIFLTAKVVQSDIERLKGLGAAGVLIKPFNPRTLPDEVRAILASVNAPPARA